MAGRRRSGLHRVRGAHPQRPRGERPRGARRGYQVRRLLHQPRRGLRRRGRHPQAIRHGQARLRARARLRDRRRRPPGGVHDHERLLRPGPPGARDAGRVGPAKGKDFATALGPVLVSPDELPPDLDLRAVARVNGEVRTDSRTGAMHYSWGELLSAAARNTTGLIAGEVIGSGPSGAAASSSTTTAAGWRPAMRSSSRSRGSACCATGSSAPA